jgi:hypothetical protein
VILTVDPDTTASGYAVGSVSEGCYLQGGLACLDAAPSIVRIQPKRVAIEIPRIHPSDPLAKVNDLIDVAMVGAEWRCLARRFAHIATYESSHWKGQLHKAHAHQHLVSSVLARVELESLVADVSHHVRGTSGIKMRRQIDAACDALAVGKKPAYRIKAGEILDAACMLMFELGRFQAGWQL